MRIFNKIWVTPKLLALSIAIYLSLSLYFKYSHCCSKFVHHHDNIVDLLSTLQKMDFITEIFRIIRTFLIKFDACVICIYTHFTLTNQLSEFQHNRNCNRNHYKLVISVVLYMYNEIIA